MKLSSFDLNQVKALHHLLEEASVSRAATHLRVTPAAASNALRRLRDALGDPLLVKQGRGLVRTRLGEELRSPARDVVSSAERLLGQAQPFSPARYAGSLPVAMAEHVAAMLLPTLDMQLRREAPHASLNIAPVPEDAEAWLLRSAGVLVGPTGAAGVPLREGAMQAEPFYVDRYVCMLRRGHPATAKRWSAASYASLEHVLVTPRGASMASAIDDQLARLSLQRRVHRTVPSFTLALSIVSRSDHVTSMPERCARAADLRHLTMKQLPLPPTPIAMHLLTHAAHARDGRVLLLKRVLHAALAALGAGLRKQPTAARG